LFNLFQESEYVLAIILYKLANLNAKSVIILAVTL